MTLRFTVLGFEIARVTLDIEHNELPHVATAVERGVKAVSKVWVKRMVG
jgi:hypothetical protein